MVVSVISNTEIENPFRKGEIRVSWNFKNGLIDKVGCQVSFKEEKEVGWRVPGSMSQFKIQKLPKGQPEE